MKSNFSNQFEPIKQLAFESNPTPEKLKSPDLTQNTQQHPQNCRENLRHKTTATLKATHRKPYIQVLFVALQLNNVVENREAKISVEL